MNATFGRRFTAYIFDMILLTILSSIILVFIPTSNNAKKLNEEMSSIAEKFTSQKISMEEYVKQVTPLEYKLQKENFISNVVVIIVFILYYIVYQFKKGGQTIGKKLMGIQLQKEDGNLEMNDLVIRSLIINSLFISLITLLVLFTTNENSYIYVSSVLTFIDGLLIVVSGVMVLFRKDKRALQDIITKTKVVEVKK